MSVITTSTRLLGAMTVAGALLFTAACGGGSGDNGTGSGVTPTAASNGEGGGSNDAFQQCLQEHGVTPRAGARGGQGRTPGARPSDRPSGPPSGRPSMSDDQREAVQACASLRPQGGQGGQGNGGDGQGGQ
jgi:hypothetical protein